MLRRAALAGLVILSVSCNRSEGGDLSALASATGSAKAGSGGSFRGDLAKELGGGVPRAGSAAGSDGKSAPKTPAPDKPGEPSAAPVGDAKGSGDAKAGDAKAGDAKAGDAKAGDAKAGGAKAGDVKAGDVKAGDVKAGD